MPAWESKIQVTNIPVYNFESPIYPGNTTVVIPSEALLVHWQGHWKLTRKMIETFPIDKLFTNSVGDSVPFQNR